MIQILNASSRHVIICIDGNDTGVLLSGRSRNYDLPSVGSAAITLKHQNESYTKTDNAHLMVETSYTLLLKEDLHLTITREKLCFELNGYYDRFILTAQNGEILNTVFSITNVEGVRKRLKRYRLLDLFVIEPLSDIFLGGFIDGCLEFGCFGPILFYLVIPIVATIFHVWKYVLIGFLILWLLTAVGEWIADVTGKRLFKKSPLKDTSALTELSKWTDPAFIADYYAQPERSPFLGEIER